jgi:hypothetical protein
MNSSKRFPQMDVWQKFGVKGLSRFEAIMLMGHIYGHFVDIELTGLITDIRDTYRWFLRYAAHVNPSKRFPRWMCGKKFE